MLDELNKVLSLIEGKIAEANGNIREIILDVNRGDIHGQIEYLTNLKITSNVLQEIAEETFIYKRFNGLTEQGADMNCHPLDDIDKLIAKL